jgi:hypothetical protein
MTEAELKQREKDLDAREKALREAETAPMDTKKRLVKPPVGAKMVKIRALRPCRYTASEGGKKLLEPGEVAEVWDVEAKELVERTSPGPYAFSGERYENDGDAGCGKIKRAEYVV